MKKSILLFCLLIVLFSNCLFSQILDSSLVPRFLGTNNMGNEFWFTIPPCYEDVSSGFQNLIKIFVTSPVKTEVIVEVPGKGYYNTRMTVPNDVIEFNLTSAKGQPYSKSANQPCVAEQVYKSNGIHVFSKQPLVVYCVVRYHWTSEGFLCIPLSSLGTEYIVSGYKVDPMFSSRWNYKLPNLCGVTAAFNDTKVTWTMGGNSKTITAGGQKPGDIKEWTLQKGDVLMYSTNSDEADLSGSKIVSTKPVSMVTGLQCADIPVGNEWCDYVAEMDIPTYAWGSRLHVPKIINRKYASLIRIYAKEPNTTIYKDGNQVGIIKSSGGVEGDGFLEMRMMPMDQNPKSVVISSDKPINVTLLNCGTQEDANGGSSDPFTMAITPYEQYQKEITFCTPGIYGGTGFSDNYINLVYQTDANGSMPDDVMFANVSYGEYKWSKLKTKFAGIDEPFTYDIDGKKFAVKCFKLPNDGVYKIKATNPFAAYSFGFSDYDSYGFLSGASFAEHIIIDKSVPLIKFTQKSDGNVDDGSVSDSGDNQSKLSFLYMKQEYSYNYTFEYDEFLPGQSTKTNWRLKVIDQSKDARAALYFTDRAGNDTTINLSYNALSDLLVSSKNIKFDTLCIKDSAFKEITLLNNTNLRKLTLTGISLKTNNPNFTLEKLSYPLVFDTLEKIKIKIFFYGLSYGNFSDSILIANEQGVKNAHIKVEGYVSSPAFNTKDMNFDPIYVGEGNSHQTLEIWNTGNMNLTVYGYKNSNDKIFNTSLPDVDMYNMFQEPIIISKGQKLYYNVTFTPSEEKVYNEYLDFYSNTIPRITYRAKLYGVGKLRVSVDEKNEQIGNPFVKIKSNTNTSLNYEYSLKTVGSMEVQVVDLNGNVVLDCGKGFYNGSISSGTINIGSLTNGVYFIQIKSNELILNEKFVITK